MIREIIVLHYSFPPLDFVEPHLSRSTKFPQLRVPSRTFLQLTAKKQKKTEFVKEKNRRKEKSLGEKSKFGKKINLV